MTAPVEIPAALIEQGRRALTDAINLAELAADLHTWIVDAWTTMDLLAGDEETSQEWSDATGFSDANSVLVAVADNIGEATASTGSYLRGVEPDELRRRLAHLLDDAPGGEVRSDATPGLDERVERLERVVRQIAVSSFAAAGAMLAVKDAYRAAGDLETPS